MNLKRIEAKTLRQQVYDQLKEKIVSAQILPGERISLRGLASQLGVSLMPVREALWQLESEKVIVIESNRHIRVANLEPAEMKEILDVRLMLEIKAARMACEHREKADLARVEKILSELDEATENPKLYMKVNRRYHFTIYGLGGSRILVELIDGLWARVGPYIYLQTLQRRDLTLPMNFHDRMFKALVDRDQTLMAEAVFQDLETAFQDITRHLENKKINEDRLGRLTPVGPKANRSS